MRKLIAILKLMTLVIFDWVVLGIAGTQIGMLYLLVTDASPVWGWLLYAVGIAVAATMVLVAASAKKRTLHWSARTTLITVPIFFCPTLLFAGVPDFSPMPILAGYALCLAASVSAFVLTRATGPVPGSAAPAG